MTTSRLAGRESSKATDHRLSTFHSFVQSVLYRTALVIGCHQLQSRSYVIRGRQVPVCARCLGLLIGVAVAPFCPLSRVTATACLVPMLLDGGSQLLSLRESTNALRLVTGIAFAIGTIRLLITALEKLWNT